MPTKFTQHFNPNATPQTQPIPGREPDMVKNAAGGFAFGIDKWARLSRFLVLGSEGGTYYVSEQTLSIDNAKNVMACIAEDGVRVVHEVREISNAGRSYRNDACLYVLALIFVKGSPEARSAAKPAFNDIVRIGTHLFTFVNYVHEMRGWGNALRNAVGGWYARDPQMLAYQLIKYRHRNGWSHRDTIRLAHPKAMSLSHNLLMGYAVKREDWKTRHGAFITPDGMPDDLAVGVTDYLEAADQLQRTSDAKEAAKLIRLHNLPREAVNSELLNSKEVWEALLEKMPLTAMIRNLGKLTSIGIIAPFSVGTEFIVSKITDADYLQKSRIHPMQILLALTTYKMGHGQAAAHKIKEGREALTWSPSGKIIDALDDAFYGTFQNVQPIGGNTMLSLDVSGSMGTNMIPNTGLSAREASAALAMVTVRVEKNYVVNGFTSGRGVLGGGMGAGDLTPLAITGRQRMDDVLKTISGLPLGGTDCALPVLHALDTRLHIDTFIIYTDNESYAGPIHASQALEQYRRSINPKARMVVVAMTAGSYSVADPKDMLSLDIVGMDSNTPMVVGQFGRGEI